MKIHQVIYNEYSTGHDIVCIYCGEKSGLSWKQLRTVPYATAKCKNGKSITLAETIVGWFNDFNYIVEKRV